MRILSVFGTRPEAIKMAPVVQELSKTPGIESIVCVTAQHRQMLDQVMDLFKIKADVDLDIMQPNQSLAQLTAHLFSRLDPVLAEINPDWVLVQGDTTTTMTAALLSYYRQMRVGHVEAGLRTYNKWHPFPEEVNRRVVGSIADLHFAHTDWAKENLLKEGVSGDHIVVTGNTVIDALQFMAKLPDSPELKALLLRVGLPGETSPGSPRLVLVTAHRRENFGEPLENICLALRQLSEHYGDAIRIIYPVHLNPNVRETAFRILKETPIIHLLEPLDYLPFVQLMRRATLLLTDSGGLQEEAPSLGVPVLVLRQVTERPEGVQAGTVRLVGTRSAEIVLETRRLLDDPLAYQEMAQAVNPYGDGRAAGRIVRAILHQT
jgi:UDP-N-acetylglucosamine 2-epimerase (non-hydrolysing)